MTLSDVIDDVTEIYKLVTGHNALKLRKKIFSIKYTRRYSYAKFGTFFAPFGIRPNDNGVCQNNSFQKENKVKIHSVLMATPLLRS